MKWAFWFLVPLVVWGQDIAVQYFTQDSDIREAYDRDDISYETYIELLRLIEEKVEVNSGDLQRLLVIPGVNIEDINALERIRQERGFFQDISEVERAFPGDFKFIEPFISVVPPSYFPLKGSLKLYTSRYFKDDDNMFQNLYYRTRWNSWEIDGGLKQYENGIVYPLYRSLEYKGKSLEFIIGSYRKKLGEGLLVGKEPYVKSSFRWGNLKTLWLSPQYGWSNGAYVSYFFASDWQVQGYISYDNFDSVGHNAFAAAVSYKKPRTGEIGIIAYRGSFWENDSNGGTFSQIGSSIFGNFSKKPLTLTGEFALLDNGSWGFYSQLLRSLSYGASLGWDFWLYHPDFRSLYSYGYCERKIYRYYSVDSLDNDLRFSQVGQVGTYGRMKWQFVGNFYGELSMSWYRVPIYARTGSYWLGAIKYLRKKDDAKLYYFRELYSRSDSTTVRDNLGISGEQTITDFLRIEYSGYYRWEESYLYERLKCSVSAWGIVWLSPWENLWTGIKIRRRDTELGNPDEGYYDFAIVERVSTEPVYLKAEISNRKYDNSNNLSTWISLSINMNF